MDAERQFLAEGGGEGKRPFAPIYIVSGGMGALGEQVVRTILPQFQGAQAPVEIVRQVRERSQLEAVVAQAAQTGGTIVHTLTNGGLRQQMIALAAAQQVAAIDIVGPLMEHLTAVLGEEPIGRPGLYRELNQAYFKRVEAIEYTLAHDDGKHYQGWPDAEIVLVGPSRVGKTPLSMYLSVLGWKVANVPLVPQITPRPELFALDRRRVVGLKIDAAELLSHRQHRQRSLGAGRRSDYNDPARLYEELEVALRLFRQGGFKVVDVTNKPIETSAGEVITAVTRQLSQTG